MTLKYEVKHLRNEDIITVYDTDAPNIKGEGRNECEALEDLLKKLKAIFEAIGRLQDHMDCGE